MFRSVRTRVTYANVVATLALCLALGGGAYAAATLPKHSVGTKQLRKGAVTGKKLHRNAVTSSKVKDGSLQGKDFAAGQLPAGQQGPKGDKGATGDTGLQGPACTARAFSQATRGAGGAATLHPPRSFNATAEPPSTANTDR